MQDLDIVQAGGHRRFPLIFGPNLSAVLLASEGSFLLWGSMYRALLPVPLPEAGMGIRIDRVCGCVAQASNMFPVSDLYVSERKEDVIDGSSKT